MTLIRTNKRLLLLSLLCGSLVFPMSAQFQRMAYWVNGGTWFWIGVTVTYLLWLIGTACLISFLKQKNLKLSTISLSVISFVLLFSDFLWTTFIIIMGLS